MKPMQIPTIHSRLIWLVLTSVIPASLMVTALIAYNYRQDRTLLEQASLSTARAMMSAVDRDLAGTQAALRALATSPYLKADSLAAFYQEAKDVLTTLTAHNILLIDPTFQQSLNTLSPFGSVLPSEVGHDAITQVFKTGKAATTDLLIGRVAKSLLIVVAVPVFRGDTVIYVLAATVWPDRLSELLTQQRLAPDWIGSIFDSTGTIVARTHQPERFVGKKGSPALISRMTEMTEDVVETKTVEGIQVLAVFSRSAISNWTVAIGIPSDALTSGLVHKLFWLLAITAILLLSSLALAWWMGSKIAGPIHNLVAPALALGSGQRVRVAALHLKEADEVGRALTRASAMLTDARYKASHDAMTGLANRALFDEILNHQLAICKRTRTTLSVVYIDLDGFKSVNDNHGHASGDKMLSMVGARLKASIRESDLAARLGGDEFALILIHAGMAAAQSIASKLIDSLSVPYVIGPLTLEISASIGIAVYPQSGTTGNMLSRHADDALYRAKAAGKRCYAMAG